MWERRPRPHRELSLSLAAPRPKAAARRFCHRARRRRNTLRAGSRHVPDIVRAMPFTSIDELESALRSASYLPERGLSTALFLSITLEKPLLLEGEAGVGKTEAAKALATATGARLIRLQCYEGLDVAHAVYEWNYSRHLLPL